MAAFWKRGHRNAVKYVALALAAVSLINFVSAESMKKFPGSFCNTFLKLKAFIHFPPDSLQEGSPRVQEERSGAVAEEVESRASVINRNHRKENSHGSTEWTLRSNKSFFRGGIKTLHNFFYTRPLLMEASATLCATIWHTQKER